MEVINMKFDGKVVKPIYRDDEKTKYVVAKDGSVYNTKSGKKLKWKIDTKGYYRVTISHKGVAKDARVHVLVAIAFVKNPKPDKYNVVHHLDDNKLNPYYKNLEWTDHKGNVRHAVENGRLNPAKCEKSGRAILTDKKVHKICKLMEDGNMTQREISKKLKVKEYLIHEIKLGHNWTDISCLYNISNCKISRPKIDKKIVRTICEDFVDNKLTIQEIADKNNVTYDAALRILNKKNYKDVSCDYDFSSYTHRKTYSHSLHKEIDMLISEGKTNKEIKKILNLPKCSKTNTLLHRKRKSN